MLEARELMVFYENMLALNNISIKCDDNTIVGVFGANSAGKSTLMYALSGIMLDIQKTFFNRVIKHGAMIIIFINPRIRMGIKMNKCHWPMLSNMGTKDRKSDKMIAAH